jgi:hypothetical protein
MAILNTWIRRCNPSVTSGLWFVIVPRSAGKQDLGSDRPPCRSVSDCAGRDAGATNGDCFAPLAMTVFGRS